MLFDDSRLDDPGVLATRDELFRPLAKTGARIRRAWLTGSDALVDLSGPDRPRAIIVTGPEARLLRAVLEPRSLVPIVAWSMPGLPAWVGALDLVVVLAPEGREPVPAVAQALRRGSRLIVVTPPDSVVADQAQSRSTTLVPVSEGSLATAVLALAALHRLELGPAVRAEEIATALDLVAEASATRCDSGSNPAKTLALEWAETTPLLWGYSVLAARAARRIGEAIRAATGQPALAADATELAPLLLGAAPVDVFADPGRDRNRLSVIIVDGLGLQDEGAIIDDQLTNLARNRGVRVSRIDSGASDDLVRYCSLLLTGLFGAAYLRLGLGR